MRMKEKMWQREGIINSSSSPTMSSTRYSFDDCDIVTSPTSENADSVAGLSRPLRPSLPSLSDPALSATWQTARRALLICRELVRTERHYLASLQKLSSGHTATPPSALMLTYLPALVKASETLLRRMETNPSAQGVAEALLSQEDSTEAAFVGWCGVVGSFFAGDGKRRERAKSAVAREKNPEPGNSNPLKQRVGSWGKRMNSIKALRTTTASTPYAFLATPTETSKKERSRPSVRDLAIVPTQRVMRYTLLYKGENLGLLFCELLSVPDLYVQSYFCKCHQLLPQGRLWIVRWRLRSPSHRNAIEPKETLHSFFKLLDSSIQVPSRKECFRASSSLPV